MPKFSLILYWKVPNFSKIRVFYMPNFSKQLTEQSVHQVHDIRLPEELLHVAHIGVEGVRRQRFLEDEVLPVLVEYHFIRIFWLFVHFIFLLLQK